jgi:uncharacterized protein
VQRLCTILVLLFGFRLFAVEVIPPAPAAYFNDYAHVVSTGTAAQLNQTLENFERQSSEQIVVAVFPKMQSDSAVADYTVRVFRSWGVGQKAKNNGAVLFVFVQDHKLFLQTGYGLEAVLPDALCKRIIDEQITPRFKAGDFDGGLTAGVQAILAATKGEYKGTGMTVADQQPMNPPEPFFDPLVLIFFLIIVAAIFLPVILGRNRFRGTQYRGSGWSGSSSAGSWLSSGGDSSDSGGDFSSGDFSGGGGSSGGGGAGGSW